MTAPVPPDADRPSQPRLADHVLSVALPLAVIGLGVALSVSGFGRALIDVCRAALP